MSLPTPDGTPVPQAQAQDSQVDSSLLLAQGIRSLALKKYPDACDNFSRAVEQLTEKHGEMAPECGDALILYGKALLYNAIAQSAVLGGGPDAKQETEQAVQNAVAGPSSSGTAGAAQPLSASSWKFSFGGDGPDEDEEEGEGGGDDEEDGQGDEEEEGGGGGGVDRDDELESAFAALEQARIIFSKVEGDEAKIKVAEVHKLLGEVEQESSHFDNAVLEYTSSLSLLSAILPPYNRSLSELHMLIALALDFIPDSVDRAVEHAEKAKAVLLLKLEQLEGLSKEERGEKDEKEMTDIRELMGDVDMKIEDLKVIPLEAPKTAAELQLDELLKGASSSSSAGGGGVVNNLNSLVKKKKKTVEATVVEEDEQGKGKRKAEEPVEKERDAEEKKVKVDEA